MYIFHRKKQMTVLLCERERTALLTAPQKLFQYNYFCAVPLLGIAVKSVVAAN